MTNETWKSLAQAFLEGEYTLNEATQLAANLESPLRKKDIDGELWLDGVQDNTSEAVYAVLSVEHANEFLLKLSEYRSVEK